MKIVFAIIGALFSVIYLINPSAGFLEFIPDNIPGFGNIDEAAITALLIGCLKVLGVDPLKIFQKGEVKKDQDVIDVD